MSKLLFSQATGPQTKGRDTVTPILDHVSLSNIAILVAEYLCAMRLLLRHEKLVESFAQS